MIVYEFKIFVEGDGYQNYEIRAKGMDQAVKQLKKTINNKSYVLLSVQKKGVEDGSQND